MIETQKKLEANQYLDNSRNQHMRTLASNRSDNASYSMADTEDFARKSLQSKNTKSQL